MVPRGTDKRGSTVLSCYYIVCVVLHVHGKLWRGKIFGEPYNRVKELLEKGNVFISSSYYTKGNFGGKRFGELSSKLLVTK